MPAYPASVSVGDRNEVDVQVVVVLQADELHAERTVAILRVRVRRLHRAAVLRHLLQLLADQRRVRAPPSVTFASL